jgi:hypothetical protein
VLARVNLQAPRRPTISLPRRARKVKLPDAVGGDTIKLPEVPAIPKRAGTGLRQFGQELSLAALIGGNLFGRLAMSPALGQISDKAERGKVLNRAWRTYGTVNSLALVTLVASWVPNRRAELGALWVSRHERARVATKDALVTGVVLTGLASAATGVGFALEAPGGAVPMESGHEAAPEAGGRASELKDALNRLGALNLAFEVALVGVNVALLQRRTRRLLRG